MCAGRGSTEQAGLLPGCGGCVLPVFGVVGRGGRRSVKALSGRRRGVVGAVGMGCLVVCVGVRGGGRGRQYARGGKTFWIGFVCLTPKLDSCEASESDVVHVIRYVFELLFTVLWLMDTALKYYSSIEPNLNRQYVPTVANVICKMVDDDQPATQHAYVQNIVAELFFRRITAPSVISVPRGEPSP